MKLTLLNSLLLGSSLFFNASAQSPGWFIKDTVASESFPSTFRCSLADVNNDNYPDIISIVNTPGSDLYKNRAPIKVYLNVDDSASTNPSDRKFIDITTKSKVNVVPPDTGQNSNAFTLADFNNDGNLDLVTGIYFHRVENYTLPGDRPQVYLGDGTGSFTCVPNSGLNAMHLFNIRQFSALDYDRDGKLDLFVAAWFTDYTYDQKDHAYLFKGNGDGSFTDVTAISGVGDKLEPNYGSAATDWNNDCWPDMFTAPYCRSGGSHWKNNGNGSFTQIGDSNGTSGYNLWRMGDGQRACTFSVVPEDVDNDGDMDLFLCVVHGGTETDASKDEFRSTIAYNLGPDSNYRFSINHSTLPVDAPKSFHRGDYNAAFLDFDNDGHKDAVMTQGTYGPGSDHTYFWRQGANGKFTDVTKELGFITGAGTGAVINPDIRNTGGIEPFDLDLDGDDDLIQTAASGATVLWKNMIGSQKNWIAVKLETNSNNTNRSCVGARIFVYSRGQMSVREVVVGRGQHTGQQPFILNFGLDTVSVVDSIRVRWPNALCETTTIYNPPVNAIAHIRHHNVGVEEKQASLPQIKVYPNPVGDYMIVQTERNVSEISTVQVLDLAGKDLGIQYYRSDNDKLVFNLSHIATGLYLVRIQMRNSAVITRRLVKQ